MNNVQLDLLRTFVDAGAARTFTEAAAQRRMSVSAVSQQIAALERQLELRLFERIGRRVRLTAAGRGLHQRLQAALARVDEVVTEAAAAEREVRGPIALGAPRAFARYWLRPRLLPLLRAHPRLELRLDFDVPSVLERRLLEGALDLALLGRPAESSGLTQVVIGTEVFCAVASPGYLTRHRRPRSHADFERLRYAVFDDDLAMHAPWWRAAFGARARPPADIAYRVANLDELLALAEAGLAVVVLPDYLVAASLARGRLVQLEPAPRPSPRRARNTLFLTGRAHAVPTARLEALRAALLAR